MDIQCAPDVSEEIKKDMGRCGGEILVCWNYNPRAKDEIRKNLYRCERHAFNILKIWPQRKFSKIKDKNETQSNVEKKPLEEKPRQETKQKTEKEGKKGKGEKVKRKRGRPKGSKNKAKKAL